MKSPSVRTVVVTKDRRRIDLPGTGLLPHPLMGGEDGGCRDEEVSVPLVRRGLLVALDVI